MSARAIGKTKRNRNTKGPWQRNSVKFLAILVALGMSVAAVLAVHDTGAFQLEGDANSDTINSAPPDDWDRVCHEVTGTDCSTTFNTTGTYANGEIGATAVAWTADNLLNGTYSTNASIFTGGGSKDPQDVNQWAWKDGAGGLPDKDNLVHAFATRYSMTPNANCPSGGAATCEVLFFGSDRFDNSGDAQQGFWFFQNRISLGSAALGGGTNFNGLHKLGDLLVISDFSNGGGTSTITIFKWNPACTATNKSDGSIPAGQCADANLQTLQTSDAANCASVGPADSFCGIVNGANGTPAPWAFVDKTSIGPTHLANTYLQGEFFEAGVNLSLLGLGNECFSSVLSETRSSTSTTATLKDFVLGQFAVCGANLVTSPSAASVAPGVSVTDTATVTGTGLSSPPDPTSPANVNFRLCGPTATTATTLCSATTGTSIGSVALDGGSNTSDGVATAVSAAVNTALNPLSPGRYCFFASWAGDSNYTSGPFEHAGNTSGSANGSECFIVIQLPTTTVTTPSDSSGVALGSSVALGTTIYDKAVVTGTTGSGTPLGTVEFRVCNPNQLTNGVCALGTGTVVSTGTLVAVAGSNPPASSTLSSGVVANIAGTWCFNGVYSPSGTTYLGSSDSTTGECVTVNPASTTTVTTPRTAAGNITGAVAVGTTVTDFALVTGTAAGGTPTGTVSFFVCSPSQVQGAAGSETCATGGSAVGGAVTLAPVAGSSPPAASATSAGVTASTVGVWCFRAVFSPSGVNYLGSSDASHTECFLVQDSTSMASAQEWLPNDSATVTASGNTALNGKIKFTLYETIDCTGTPVTGQAYEFTLTNASSAADRTKKTTNSTYFVLATKSVSWKVEFEPAVGTNVTGSSHCEKTSLTITN